MKSWHWALIFSLMLSCGSQTATTTAAEPTTLAAPTVASTTFAPTTTAPTTTTLSPEQLAELEREEAVDLIADVWRGFSDSWQSGLETGYQYMEENNHPAAGCTAADYESYWQYDEGTELEVIVDQDTVERDDGWVSPAIDDVPEGTIYIYTINATARGVGSEMAEVHAAILDDQAFFFFDCRDPAT